MAVPPSEAALTQRRSPDGSLSLKGRPPMQVLGASGVVVLFAFWAIWFLHSLEIGLRFRRTIARYDGPQWFLSYSHGFVRRGLPGEVLSLIAHPSPLSVRVAGWSMTLAALVATSCIVGVAIRKNVPVNRRGLTACVILMFPLALGSVLRNADYFDEIGLVLIALSALSLNRTRISPRLALTAISLLTAIAVACEEFLLLFLAPFAVVAALRCLDLGNSPTRDVVARRLVRPLGLALAPALILELLCAIRQPSAAYLTGLNVAAGHRPNEFTAATALKLSMWGQVKYGYTYSGGARYTALTIVIWLLVYVVGVWAFAAAQSRLPAWHLLTASYCAAAAFAMNVIFVDARRWWTLAFVTYLALVTIAAPQGLSSEGRASFQNRWRRGLAVPATLLISVVALQFPLTTIHPSDLTNHSYWTNLSDSWIPGPNSRYSEWLHRAYSAFT